MHTADDALRRLRAEGDPASLAGRARYGIPETDAYGVSLPRIRALAKEIGRDARLAEELWQSGVHEARLLATLVMPPEAFTRAQAERWLADVRSWDVCDAVTFNLADRTRWAFDAAPRWAARPEEWTKRAGFGLMAGLAVHDKDAPDERFVGLLPVIEAHADDERNFVKKAASWALRGIGKRAPGLRRRAIASAKRLRAHGGKGARWVGADALRELENA